MEEVELSLLDVERIRAAALEKFHREKKPDNVLLILEALKELVERKGGKPGFYVRTGK